MHVKRSDPEWADPGVLWKKAPRAIRAMRGKTLQTVPFNLKGISTVLWVHQSFPKVLSAKRSQATKAMRAKQAVTVPPQPCFGFHWQKKTRTLLFPWQISETPKSAPETALKSALRNRGALRSAPESGLEGALLLVDQSPPKGAGKMAPRENCRKVSENFP